MCHLCIDRGALNFILMQQHYLTHRQLVDSILQNRAYGASQVTPLSYLPEASKALGNSISLKREDLQKVRSFKARGAQNKILHLTQESQKKGVVACSAGNHAQGVALVAQQLGIQSVIFMPVTVPITKMQNVKKFGAKIELVGDSFDECYEYAEKYSLENKT